MGQTFISISLSYLRGIVLVSQKPGLDYINFSWNKMTAAEFECQWKEKKMNKKADFIHLIQVVAPFHPPVDFIQSSSSECDRKSSSSGKCTDAVLCDGPRSHSEFLPESPGQEREAPHHSGVG